MHCLVFPRKVLVCPNLGSVQCYFLNEVNNNTSFVGIKFCFFVCNVLFSHVMINVHVKSVTISPSFGVQRPSIARLARMVSHGRFTQCRPQPRSIGGRCLHQNYQTPPLSFPFGIQCPPTSFFTFLSIHGIATHLIIRKSLCLCPVSC